jgi:hypothetical protein
LGRQRYRGSGDQGQPGQKVYETPIPTIKSWVVACACHLSYVGSINRRIVIQAGLGKTIRPALKNN